MFLNFPLLIKQTLQLGDVELLTAIKLNSAGKNEEYLKTNLTDEAIGRFEALNYIKEVKASKKEDSVYKRLRTTDIANKLLVNLSFAADYEDCDELLIDWLVQTYRKRGGSIKNRKESLRRLSWFRKITTLEGNELANLLLCYVNDTFVSDSPNFMQEFYEAKKENNRLQLSQLVDNIMWKPESMYDKNYTLEKSPLYNYYDEHKEFVDRAYANHLKRINE